MAYVTEQIIDSKREAIKALNKKYKIKATLSGKNSSCLKLTINSGSIDFIANHIKVIENDHSYNHGRGVTDERKAALKCDQYLQINHYYLDRAFSGKALEYLEAAKEILFQGHTDDSDIQSDYFSCSYYVNIHLGKWNKGYTVSRIV